MVICEYCGASFKRDYNLRKHQSSARYCIKLQGIDANSLGKVECEYCGASFSTESNLRKHQQVAEYCLKMQGNNSKEFTCEFCNRGYTRKDSLLKHHKQCGNKRVEDIIDKKVEVQNNQLLELIKELQTTITTMQQNTIGNTTNINRNNVILQNLPPIKDEDFQEYLEHLTLNFIQDGAKGYADFANCYPFKDRIVCTDKSRKKLKYKDNDGEVIEDGGGIKLAKRFFQAIAPRNEELINAEYKALHQEVQEIATSSNAYRSDLSGLLAKATHLQEMLIKCQEAASGQENELTKDFVSHLSKLV